MRRTRIGATCGTLWLLQVLLVGASPARAGWLDELKEAATQPVREIVDETKRETRDEVRDTTEKETRDVKDAVNEAVDCARRGGCPESDAVSAATEEPAPLAPVSSGGAAFDVVGMQLGMTPSSIRSVLDERVVQVRDQQAAHAVETTTRRVAVGADAPLSFVGTLRSSAPVTVPAGSDLRGASVVGQDASGAIQVSTERIEVEFVSSLSGNRAAQIHYRRGFPKPPPLAPTEAQLVGKYGTPGLRTVKGSRTVLEWTWDASGRPLGLERVAGGLPEGRACLSVSPAYYAGGSLVGNQLAAVPPCGRAILVGIDARDGYVDTVDVWHVDHALLRADQDAIRDARQSRQQKAEQERREGAVVPTF